MTAPSGISRDQARAHIAVLDLLLASTGLDADTERRAQWLRLRLVEIAPEDSVPVYDFTDARLELMFPEVGLFRAAA